MIAIAKTPDITSVHMNEDVRVEYEQRSFLGIIKWWVEVKVDRLGKDLVIDTTEQYDQIILNGKVIKGITYKIR